jgi:hypothetical protein
MGHNLVHASPGAFGSVTPDMAWMRDDFPELCEPMTTTMGRSISTSNLFVCQPDSYVPDVLVEARQDEARCSPDVVEGIDEA